VASYSSQNQNPHTRSCRIMFVVSLVFAPPTSSSFVVFVGPSPSSSHAPPPHQTRDRLPRHCGRCPASFLRRFFRRGSPPPRLPSAASAHGGGGGGRFASTTTTRLGSTVEASSSASSAASPATRGAPVIQNRPDASQKPKIDL
jgi:hypothetical protein